MDKSWIHIGYEKNIQIVLNYLLSLQQKHIDCDGKTHCLCQKCGNRYKEPIKVVETHMYSFGVAKKYWHLTHYREQSHSFTRSKIKESINLEELTNDIVDPDNDEMLDTLEDIQ